MKEIIQKNLHNNIFCHRIFEIKNSSCFHVRNFFVVYLRFAAFFTTFFAGFLVATFFFGAAFFTTFFAAFFIAIPITSPRKKIMWGRTRLGYFHAFCSWWEERDARTVLKLVRPNLFDACIIKSFLKKENSSSLHVKSLCNIFILFHFF